MLAGRRLPPRRRARLLTALVLTDLVAFTLLAVVAVLPGLGRTGHHGQAGSKVLLGESSGSPGAARLAAARPAATLGYPGRFAVYDPGELDAGQLTVLGSPDLNVLSGTPSVQGYSSLVNGRYAAATGSHRATGEGQDELSPAAVGDGVLDQLDTSDLLTPPGYLITAAGQSSPAAAGPPGTGRRTVAADQQAIWYFGASLQVSSLQVPDSDAAQDVQDGTARVGLVTPAGRTRWFRAAAAPGPALAVRLRRPVTSVAAVAAVRPGHRTVQFGPPSIADAAASVFVADGQLQDALTPPRWDYAGHDGAFAVFADRFARGPLSLSARPGRSVAGASVTRAAGPVTEPTAARVASAHGVEVIRSVTAIPGWTATWHPRHGSARALTVRAAGLVQAVLVPAGAGLLTWSYVSPGFGEGVVLSLGAGAVLVLLLLVASGFQSGRHRAGRVPGRAAGGGSAPAGSSLPAGAPAGGALCGDAPGDRVGAGGSQAGPDLARCGGRRRTGAGQAHQACVKKVGGRAAVSRRSRPRAGRRVPSRRPGLPGRVRR